MGRTDRGSLGKRSRGEGNEGSGDEFNGNGNGNDSDSDKMDDEDDVVSVVWGIVYMGDCMCMGLCVCILTYSIYLSTFIPN